jgi:hypothetical protein
LIGFPADASAWRPIGRPTIVNRFDSYSAHNMAPIHKLYKTTFRRSISLAPGRPPRTPAPFKPLASDVAVECTISMYIYLKCGGHYQYHHKEYRYVMSSLSVLHLCISDHSPGRMMHQPRVKLKTASEYHHFGVVLAAWRRIDCRTVAPCPTVELRFLQSKE